jgi:signal transduction histidine kinase
VLEPLSRLRVRLTAWYAATLTVILVLLGGGLFFAIREQYSREMRRSLRVTTTDAIRNAQALGSRALVERSWAAPADHPARRSERTTYLLTADGHPVSPTAADPWVREAAVRAARDGTARDERDGGSETTLRLRAERFALSDGTTLVAAVVDRSVELEDRYAELIAAFGAAAVAAVILVGGGGWILVRKASAPVGQTIEHMRRFMADAAHELRTPVTIVRTRAEVALQRERSTDDYVTALQGVAAEARQLAHVVDSLFVLARAEAGERPQVTAGLYLDDIVLETAQSAAVVAQMAHVTVSVVEYEEAVVDGDAALLRRLTMNILDNAIKFTPPGGEVTVRVSGLQHRPTLSVEDTGIGIAPEHLPHVFDRFFRVRDPAPRDLPVSPDRGGAGLGLAIAKWIASAHGASIHIDSTPGAGTRVTVQFPPSVKGGAPASADKRSLTDAAAATRIL